MSLGNMRRDREAVIARFFRMSLTAIDENEEDTVRLFRLIGIHHAAYSAQPKAGQWWQPYRN